jgi:hypothetical protein
MPVFSPLRHAPALLPAGGETEVAAASMAGLTKASRRIVEYCQLTA